MQVSHELLYKFLDRDVTDQERSQVLEWLAQGRENCMVFARLANDERALAELVRREAMRPVLDSQAMRALLLMEQAAEVHPDTYTLPRPSRRDVALRKAEAQQRQRKEIVLPLWLVVGGLAAAAMVLLSLVLIPDPPASITAPPVADAAAAQAVIEFSSGATWAGDATGRSLGPGQRLPEGRLELTSGRMTIRFDGGTRVAVAAPCVFQVANGEVLDLLEGSAVVESPSWAPPFTVNTPEHQMVDHGSTFGVVSQTASVQVHVFLGELDVFARAEAEGDRAPLVRAISLESFRTDTAGGLHRQPFAVDLYQPLATTGLVPTVTERTAVFRQGLNGYTGAVDTWFSVRTNPVETGGLEAETYLRVGLWSAANQQALLRFDGLFDPGANGIPGSARVLSAELVLHNPADISDTFGSRSAQGDAFAVHRVLTRWHGDTRLGSASWAGGATQQVDLDDREAAAQPLDDAKPFVSPAADYVIPDGTRIALDVSEAVRAWSLGEPNYGLLLQSIGIDPRQGDPPQDGDAIFLASSEYTTDRSLRPTLSITYLVIEDVLP